MSNKKGDRNEEHGRTGCRRVLRSHVWMPSPMDILFLLLWSCAIVSVVCNPTSAPTPDDTGRTEVTSRHNNEVGLDRRLDNFFDKAVPKDRVIQGQVAPRGRYPFYARQRNLVSNSFLYACGGTLIAPQYVLTAAHCVANFTLDPQSNATTPHASTLRNDLWGFTVGYYCGRVRNCQQPSFDVKVEEWFLHPNYYRSSVWWIHDLAIARLEIPITNERILSSIPLLDTGFIIENRLVAHQRNLTLIGSGWTNDRGKFPRTLQRQPMQYVDTAACESRWGLARGTMRDDVFCTRVVGGGVCFGDSGGPIVYEGRDRMVLVGIPNGIYALSCQDKEGNPDIQGRIADPSKLGWIHSVVCADPPSRSTALCKAVTPKKERCRESPDATFARKPNRVGGDTRIQKCSWLVTRTRIKRYCLKKRFGAKKKCKVSCGICLPL